MSSPVSVHKARFQSDDQWLHHQLVEKWFRERIFLSPSDSNVYSPASIKVDEVDSVPLFSDDLVAHDIRISISRTFDDDETDSRKRENNCNLSYRVPPRTNEWSELNSCENSLKDSPQQEKAFVAMNGCPLFPQCDKDDTNKTVDTHLIDYDAIEIEEEEQSEENFQSQATLQRTFSFDEQIPNTYRTNDTITHVPSFCVSEISYDESVEESLSSKTRRSLIIPSYATKETRVVKAIDVESSGLAFQ